MEFMLISLLSLILLFLVVIFVLVYKGGNSRDSGLGIEIKYKLDALSAEVNRVEASVKNEIATNRTEGNEVSRNAREELSRSLKSFEDKLNGLTLSLEGKLTTFGEASTLNSKE